jgi:alkanesulfonate monooxygenase SsuD/methylene tetrahydromethanopterin reductase-like flavin-dependent oxidoreductase (luciferase family)
VVALGITLPSFREDPEPALGVAAAAEEAGLDGVFLYDHLFRRNAAGAKRPALELLAMMSAVAAETARVGIGSLVARATLRPPAVLAAGFDTVARVAGPGRVIAGVGAGDHESKDEMVEFGLEFGDLAYRVAALAATVDATRDRGYPVWVGGHDPAVREIAAARADGWNRWGGSPKSLGVQAEALRIAAGRQPFTISWGGLAVLAATEADAVAKANRLGAGPGTIVGGPAQVAATLADYVEAGADWLVLGPVDPSDRDNARLLGEKVVPLLA